MTTLSPDIQARKDKLFNDLEYIIKNPVVVAAYNEAIAHVQPILADGTKNPWVGQDIRYFVDYFDDWFAYLPEPTGGLGKIVPFTYFYLNNSQAYYFLNQFKSAADGKTYTTEIFNWTVEFIKTRGEFMGSPDSNTYIEEWVNDPGTHIDDFIQPDPSAPDKGFKTFNHFFTRELNMDKVPLPRPISAPDDHSILTAPADSEINFIQTDLTLKTLLPVKTRQINVAELLDQSDYAFNFEGGTAISCVLMPNSYHHYHSPVSGKIVEAKEVKGIYNGIIDGDHWFNKGNIGESTTDFSIFENFHRSYYIIDTHDFGFVAMIPVGLNTISDLEFSSLIPKGDYMVDPGKLPVDVEKGAELGHFAYGGSLNILLFQKDVISSLSVLMGQRIGKMAAVKKEVK